MSISMSCQNSSVHPVLSSRYFTTYPRRFQRIWGGVSAWVPPVGHNGVEPPLEAAQVVGVIHIGLRQRNVTHKGLKAHGFEQSRAECLSE